MNNIIEIAKSDNEWEEIIISGGYTWKSGWINFSKFFPLSNLFQEFVACIIIHKCGFSHFKIQRNNTFNQYQSKKKLKRSKKKL
jgi:hypothetical protein